MVVIGALAFVAGVGTGYLAFDDRPNAAGPGALDVACQVDGRHLVKVPDLLGEALGDATAQARAGGLQVVGTGVSGGDSAAPSSRVVAQAPPGGTLVPSGACIGFRTRG